MNQPQYIYHFLPKNMKGTTLIPLNEQKERFPDLFKSNSAKYEGRESLMDRRIPYLDCLWNDVLHWACLDPRVLAKKFEELGMPVKVKPEKLLRMNIQKLANRKAVKYDLIFSKPQKGGNCSFDERDFSIIDPESFTEETEIKPEMCDYISKLRGDQCSALMVCLCSPCPCSWTH